MHCNCVVYFSGIAWNNLEDFQNYSNYSRLCVISSYRHSSDSQTILHRQIAKSKSSPVPVPVKKTWIWSRSHFLRLRLRSCPKFLYPGPDILKIWESDSCSDSGYNHRSNHNLCFCQEMTEQTPITAEMEKYGNSGSGSGFS